jgi:hypothetical protein
VIAIYLFPSLFLCLGKGFPFNDPHHTISFPHISTTFHSNAWCSEASSKLCSFAMNMMFVSFVANLSSDG